MGNAYSCCTGSGQGPAVVQGTSTRSSSSSPPEGLDGDRSRNFKLERMGSGSTLYFDAMDEFPPQEDMMYPPAQSMRQLPSEVDLQQPGTLPLLLNASSRKQLKSQPSVPASHFATRSSADGSRLHRNSVVEISECLVTETSGTQGRGYPGELTEFELETCLEFRDQLKVKDSAFKEMVMSMHPHEPEAFALCRFLRARDFDVDDVFRMMSERNQPENWRVAKGVNFYQDLGTSAPEFNGCPLPVFLTQFPLIHSGIGKNGAIVLYFRAGKVNFAGIECIVGDLTNALPVCWNRLYHGTRKAMEREIARCDSSSTTVLAEKIMVVDLKGDAAFTSGLDFLRVGPTAGTCFPETVNRTYILNAPFSFSVVWTVVKKLLDPRTVQKIGFFSTTAKAKSDFLEHIEPDELLSSYGGTGESFEEIFAKRQKEFAHKEGIVRYVVEHLVMNGKEKGFPFDLSSGETVDSIVVYSRSNNGCEIAVIDNRGKQVVGYTKVQRDRTTEGQNGSSNNNYAIEVASSEHFAQSPTGSFVANTKGGTKGDNFLVAVSIAKKQ